ncbi:PAS domain-containing protein [Paenibacillus piri]|nr:PAS domain-containing protein [Paenibacillus piri]
MDDSSGSTRILNLLKADTSAHWLHVLTCQWFTQPLFGAAILSLECRFLEVNPAFRSMLDCDETQMRQVNLSALVHPDELLRCMHLSSQLAAGAIPSFQAEQRFLKPSGEPVWCFVYATLLRDEHGEPSYLLMLTQNIDDRKKLEATSQTAVHTMSALLESIPFALMLVKANGEISYANKASEPVLNRRREELLGQNIWKSFPKLTATPLYSVIQRAMEEKSLIRHHHFDEKAKRWYEISCQPTKEGVCLFWRERSSPEKP